MPAPKKPQPPVAEKPGANDIDDLMGEPTMSIGVVGDAKLPEYLSPGGPAFQLFNTSGFTRIRNGTSKLLKTGIGFQVPDGKAVLVYPLPYYSKGVTLQMAGGVRVIDSSNMLPVEVTLFNDSGHDVDIEMDDPIVHAIVIDAQRWAFTKDL
jgi:dUTPase